MFTMYVCGDRRMMQQYYGGQDLWVAIKASSIVYNPTGNMWEYSV